MTHTCNKCRTQYESGAFYGGHDYCMGCYVAVMREEEQKRRREEAIRAEAAAKVKREQERRLVEYEMKKREMLDERKKKSESKDARGYSAGGWVGGRTAAERKKEDEKELLKRRLYDDWKKRLEMLRAAREKKEEREMPQRRKERVYTTEEEGVLAQEGYDISSMRELVIEGPSSPKKRRVEEQVGRLELSVRKGLPVSISIGQKRNKAVLSGSNLSAHRANAQLFAIAHDEKGKRVECRVEPGECHMEPNASAEFSIEFDLEEDAARGEFKLEAYLKEKAVYLEGGVGRSNTVALGTNVKTPMQLEYIKGSAEFEEGSLLLAFENKGESGGIVGVKSRVEYGEESANLKEKKSVKGYEKKVVLEFAPAREGELGSMKVSLFGVDANGKEYKLVKSVKEKP